MFNVGNHVWINIVMMFYYLVNMRRDNERDEIDEWYENELYEAHEILTKTCNKARDKYRKRVNDIQKEYTEKIKKYYKE